MHQTWRGLRLAVATQATSDSPLGTYDPGILQRDHVVDVDVRGRGPGVTIIRAVPRPLGCRARRVNDDSGPITFQHVFPAIVSGTEEILGRVGAMPSITSAGDGDPGREEISIITGSTPRRRDGQSGQ